MRRNLLFAFLLLSTISSLSACAGPLRYSAEPTEATIVDAETKQPIEGVIIVAHWELERGTEGGNVPVGQLKMMEAVTDKEGKFSFPGFGPETVWTGFLVDKDPELIIFKSGYEYRRLLNPYTSDEALRTRKVRRSDWSGKTIALKPFRGTEEEYARHLGFMGTSLEAILREECGWKKIPRMILTVSKQSEIFRKRGIYELPSIESLEVRYSNFKAKCGSIKEFFRSNEP